MGIMFHFNAPEDYKPEIPAGASCQSCVFATGITARSSGEFLALCRRLTGEVGFSVWLKMGEDNHPLRSEQCIKDYPYGATFDLVANKKPLSEVEKAIAALLPPIRVHLTEDCDWKFEDADREARKMVNRLITAVKTER